MQRSVAWGRMTAAIATAVALAAAPGLGRADPVFQYGMVLTITSTGGSGCIPSTFYPGFGCDLAVGDQWTGSFSTSVDLTQLPDGGYSIPLISFFLRTGDIDWSEGLGASTTPCRVWETHPNCFTGFRNNIEPPYIGASNPGFYVSDGRVTGISGGLIGPGDAISVDFDYFNGPPGAGKFSALSNETAQYPSGTYSVFAIPEPGTLALTSLGLLVVGLARRTCSRAGMMAGEHRQPSTLKRPASR